MTYAQFSVVQLYHHRFRFIIDSDCHKFKCYSYIFLSELELLNSDKVDTYFHF